jgi:hypothetical protein
MSQSKKRRRRKNEKREQKDLEPTIERVIQ